MKILPLEYMREDGRGSLIQLSTGDWKQCNILEIKKGHTFGGHYHKHKKELFFLISGSVIMEINSIKKKQFLIYALKGTEAFLVEPYDKHTITATENSVLVELLSRPYNEEDTFNE